MFVRNSLFILILLFVQKSPLWNKCEKHIHIYTVHKHVRSYICVYEYSICIN